MVQGGASPQFAAQIIHRLAKTLAFAHQKGIVHRDLKPANILVQRKDGGLILLIADFGIGGVAAAQVIRKETGRPATREQTMPTAVRGAYTPLYASPQQRRGDKPDPRDDVHALGVIWHQWLVGDLTAERPGGRGWRKKLEGRGMMPGLIDLLESCIDDDPEERPANAAELASRIDRLLNSVPKSDAPRPGDIVTNSLGMKFAWIPPGTFLMGGDRFDDEKPAHRVTLTKGFYMSLYPVTQEQWQVVMGSNPSRFQGADRPVETVTWNDCQDFCERLAKSMSTPVRLPTEAEWEYACRAGTTTDYHGGNGEGALKKVGWFSGNSNGQTKPVGLLAPNAWGLYDMHGNVGEWCQDWHGPYPEDDVKDPSGPEAAGYRSLRGGSWNYPPEFCRAAHRLWFAPSSRSCDFGCRVLLD
jgi:formylglycine-generating enzyme required for sulfatase activity